MSAENETIADIAAFIRKCLDMLDTELSRKSNGETSMSAEALLCPVLNAKAALDRLDAARDREIVELKRKYGCEEVYCAHCGEKLEKVMLHKFAFNGDEYDDDFPCEFSATLMEDGSIGICICTDRNWCGYDLTEGEQREDISCPKCGKFPFSDGHIEVEEPDNVFVSCWTKKGVADGIR